MHFFCIMQEYFNFLARITNLFLHEHMPNSPAAPSRAAYGGADKSSRRAVKAASMPFEKRRERKGKQSAATRKFFSHCGKSPHSRPVAICDRTVAKPCRAAGHGATLGRERRELSGAAPSPLPIRRTCDCKGKSGETQHQGSGCDYKREGYAYGNISDNNENQR